MFCCPSFQIILEHSQSRLVIAQLVDQRLLLLLHLNQTLILDLVALQLPLLLVQKVVQLHHLLLSVFIFSLDFVSFAQRSQLLLLDLHGKLVQRIRHC